MRGGMGSPGGPGLPGGKAGTGGTLSILGSEDHLDTKAVSGHHSLLSISTRIIQKLANCWQFPSFGGHERTAASTSAVGSGPPGNRTR